MSNQSKRGSKKRDFRSFDPTAPALLVGLAVFVLAGLLSFRTLFMPTPFDSFIGEENKAIQSLVTATQSRSPNIQKKKDNNTKPVLSSVEVFSWSDDDGDHPDLAPYLFDNSSETIWRSRYFVGNTFAEGAEIALLVRLAEPAVVSNILIDFIGSGGLLEVIQPDSDNPRQGTVVDTVPLETKTSIHLDPSLELNSIGLVFKELPVDDEGRYRAKISNIAID